MENFLNSEFLHNTGHQWLTFIGTLAGILILSPLLSKILGRAFFQFFRKIAPGKIDRFTSMLLSPLVLFIGIIAFSFAIQFMTFPPEWDKEYYGIRMYIMYSQLMKFLIVVFAARVILRTVDFIGEVLHDKAKLTASTHDDQYVLFLKDIFKVVVYVVVLFVILGGIFELNISSLLAGAGLAGLAVALAAQDSLQNLLGSISIFTEKPFVVGDLIEVDGITGSVEKVGFRSTRLRTLEKTFVTLPNKTLMQNALNNLTERTLRRVSTNVGLTYGTSVSKINHISSSIREYLNDHPDTTTDNVVGMSGFGNSSLDILVQFFIRETGWADFIRIRDEILLNIMEIVETGGGDFAFPTQTVHLVQSTKEP